MKYKITVLSFFLSLTIAFSQNSGSSTVGPENGTLLIVGGGKLSATITDRFIELAGGIDAKFVLVPTASGNEEYMKNPRLLQLLKEKGATNVTVLHTNDRNIANSDEFTQPLLEADAIWFGGGRQWRLVDSYKDTKTETLFHKVLERGGVIGGTSAGATIQGSFLARGDTKNNQIMSGDHKVGFSFIKNIAIDQHLIARNRQFDMFTIQKEYPELLGIGLDEDTAIVVTGDTFEVIGSHYVLMYDGTFWSTEGSNLKQLPSKENLFYFLSSGDKYDLKSRKVITE